MWLKINVSDEQKDLSFVFSSPEEKRWVEKRRWGGGGGGGEFLAKSSEISCRRGVFVVGECLPSDLNHGYSLFL